MCGIIGIVSQNPVADRLVDGLKRMEYRGYDSAGVCTIDHGALIRRRAPGKLAHLVQELAAASRARHCRHRAHPLGDARRAHRQQRASACDRGGGAGPQRHHRELQAAARGAARRGAQAGKRDRQRGRRASDQPRGRERRLARGGGGDRLASAARGFCAGDRVPRAPRDVDRRKARFPAGGGVRRDRDVPGVRCACARVADPADRVLRGGRLGRH